MVTIGGGFRFALGHSLWDVAGLEADFRLYGHNFKLIERGLNGVLGVNFVLLPSGRTYRVKYPPSGTDFDRGYRMWRGYVMRVIRFGPSIIFLRTHEEENVKAAISRLFGGVEEIPPTDEAIRRSREFETIVFVTDEWEKETIPPDTAFLLSCHVPVVLSKVVNRKLPVEKVHVESVLILMRIPERVEEGLKLLAEKYGGKVMDVRTAFDEGEAGDTIIGGVTRKNLNSPPIGPEDIEGGAILIHRDFLKVYHELTIDVPPFFCSNYYPGGRRSPSRSTTRRNATMKTSSG